MGRDKFCRPRSPVYQWLKEVCGLMLFKLMEMCSKSILPQHYPRRSHLGAGKAGVGHQSLHSTDFCQCGWLYSPNHTLNSNDGNRNPFKRKTQKCWVSFISQQPGTVEGSCDSEREPCPPGMLGSIQDACLAFSFHFLTTGALILSFGEAKESGCLCVQGFTRGSFQS